MWLPTSLGRVRAMCATKLREQIWVLNLRAVKDLMRVGRRERREALSAIMSRKAVTAFSAATCTLRSLSPSVSMMRDSSGATMASAACMVLQL